MFCYWFSFEWQRRVRKQDTAQNKNSDYCFDICCITWVKLMMLGRNAKSKRMLQLRVQWPSLLEIFPGISCKKLKTKTGMCKSIRWFFSRICVFIGLSDQDWGDAQEWSRHPSCPSCPLPCSWPWLRAGPPCRPGGGGYIVRWLKVCTQSNRVGQWTGEISWGIEIWLPKKVQWEKAFYFGKSWLPKKIHCKRMHQNSNFQNKPQSLFQTVSNAQKNKHIIHRNLSFKNRVKEKESEKHDIKACIVFSVCWTKSHNCHIKSHSHTSLILSHITVTLKI